MTRNPARPARLRPSRDGDLLQNEIFTTIFNEVFLIGSTQGVERSEPKSCVFPSSSPSLLRRRQPLMRSAFPALKRYGLRIPGHTRCGGCGCQGTSARSAGTHASKSPAMQTDVPRDAGYEIGPLSAIAVPRPRPRSQNGPTDSESEPLPAFAKPASVGEARSILILGAPMRIDATWDELFAALARRVS